MREVLLEISGNANLLPAPCKRMHRSHIHIGTDPQSLMRSQRTYSGIIPIVSSHVSTN
jgi:hypothetical protein